MLYVGCIDDCNHTHDKDIFSYIFPPRIDKKYKIWHIQTMKRDKIGKRVCDFRLEDLAEAKGISKRSVIDTLPNKFGRFSDNGSLKPIR